MKDFILFMYNDAINGSIANDDEKWNIYFSCLRASGRFDGGSSIGAGTKFKKSFPEEPSEPSINGFIRVRAESNAEAQAFLSGNPIYEAGGTVEIRELSHDE